MSQPGSKSRACWVRNDFASGFVFRLPYQYCGSQVVEKASKEINCASKGDREEQDANGQPKEPTDTLKLAFSLSHARTSFLRLRIGEQKCVRNCSRWDWKRLSGWSYALFLSLLPRRRSRLHKETSIGRRLPIPVERLMKPPW